MKRATIPYVIARTAIAALMLGGFLVGVPWFAAGAAPARALQGQFATTILYEQVPKDVSQGPSAIGRWKVTFGTKGDYSLARLDVGTVVTGSYKVSGNTVTITDKSGLLACNASGNASLASGTYTWKMKNGNLTLTPKQDDCAVRRLILTAHTLTTYVECLTKPMSIAATPAATPPAESTVSPNAKVLVPALGTATAGVATNAGPASNKVIDQLLSQLTACWATGDPARILPLFSQNLLSQLESEAGSLEQVVQILQPYTTLQLSWTRAGNVSTSGANTANAVVKVSTDQSQDFLRFTFVTENGAWRIDTFILGPNEVPGSQAGGGTTPTPGA